MVSLINWFTDDVKKIIWFNKWFPSSIFEDIDKLVVIYIEFCGKMSITVNDKSFKIFSDIELISKMKELKFNFKNNKIIPYIDYELPRALEQAMPIVIEVLKTTIDSYVKEPRGESFKLDVKLALKKELEEKTRMVFLQTTQELSTGYNSDAVAKSETKLNEIRKIYSDKCLDSLSIITGDIRDVQEEEESIMLFPTSLPTLDKDLYGGISTSNIYAIVGQPKSGKTRFLCNLIYKALCNGVNVYFDSAEMSELRIKNILVSIHCHLQYNTNIPDERMRTNSLKDDEKVIIRTAREELFGQNKLVKGNLIINHNVTVSNLKTGLLEAIELYGVSMYCLDYAGFVGPGDDKNLQKQQPYEWISRIYRDIHDVILTNPLSVIVLNQFNEKGISNIASGKELDSSCIEGGQAVGRTADYIVALTYDPRTRINQRKLSIILTRISAGFKSLVLKCNIGISDFAEYIGVGG